MTAPAALEKALTTMEDAVERLNKLNMATIQEITALRQPPDMVSRTMDAILFLTGVPPSNSDGTYDWPTARAALRDGEFLNRLRHLGNTSNNALSKSKLDTLKNRYLAPLVDPADPTKVVPSVARASSAADALAHFVVAVATFAEASQAVAPSA